MIILQFIFYFAVNKFFDVPDRIMYNTFFIYLILNFTKNMYSFKTILIWEELKKQIQVHAEFLLVMLVNDIAFWESKYILVHIIVGLTFTFFNLFIIKFIRKICRKILEKRLLIIGIGNTARNLTKVIFLGSFVCINIFAGIVFKINEILGTNYMYINYKPAFSSPLDFFGPWPHYIIIVEIIYVVFGIICWLPFKKKHYKYSNI